MPFQPFVKLFALILFIWSTLTAVGCAPSGNMLVKANQGLPAGRGYIQKQLPSGRKYAVYIPTNYDAAKSVPAIVFLHGLGEAGSEGLQPVRIGIGPNLVKHPGWPFVVIFPQSGGTWERDSDDVTEAITALDTTLAQYPKIDRKRVSVTGLSTGGTGAWIVAAKYRDRFAACVPIAGYSSGASVAALKGMPVWAFHNGGDPLVFSSHTKSMIKKLQAQGDTPTYTEFGSIAHNAWNKAYSDPALIRWMLAQRRP